MGATVPAVCGRAGSSGFDPRPRVGATTAPPTGARITAVSIRAPGWGRRSRAPRSPASAPFRSAPPGGGDGAVLKSNHAYILRFDPRPRVGATDGPLSGKCTWTVSIRAPGWGRRRHPCQFAAHTVSIRAPGWGRRRSGKCRQTAAPGFDPRPRVGATALIVPVAGSKRFRSAPPGGGDVSGANSVEAAECFDPRPRVGATTWARSKTRIRGVSIRAPGWGRRGASVTVTVTGTFRSAPPGGGDQAFLASGRFAGMFRSAPPGGGDGTGLCRIKGLRDVSIRAPGWGRLEPEITRIVHMAVSIRAPGWGRPVRVDQAINKRGFRSAPPGGGDTG